MTLFQHFSVFQILSVTLLAGLLIRDLLLWSRSPLSILARVLRCSVWIGTAAAIMSPLGLVQHTAEFLGIARGADAVLYLFVLAFLWSSFSFYTRSLRLEREITTLTRHIAIRDAVQGSSQPQDPAGTSGEGV